MSKLKKLIFFFCIAFIALVLVSGFIFKVNYVAPILMYHSVNPEPEPGNRIEISVKSFERQMHFLKKNRYNVVTLEKIAEMIKRKRKIPFKTVVITFDDGYKDNYTYAFPILKKYNLPATIFIIVNEVGRPKSDRLSWQEIKIMQDSGLISFGSHCLDPEPLVNLDSEEELKKQIFLSKRILEKRLGRQVDMFSHPEGQFNAKIKRLVKQAGYGLAVATNPGRKFIDNDLFALKRIRISSTSDNLFVFFIESSGFYNVIREYRHK